MAKSDIKKKSVEKVKKTEEATKNTEKENVKAPEQEKNAAGPIIPKSKKTKTRTGQTRFLGKNNAERKEKTAAVEPAPEIKTKKINAAATALLKFVNKNTEESNPLFGGNNETVSLQYSLIEMPRNFTKTKFMNAKMVRLPHPMFGPKTEKTSCLIVRDPHPKNPEFWKTFLEKQTIPGLKKIMPVKKLKGKYHGFEEKRNLAQRFDLFLVDQKIAALMPNVMGSSFFRKTRKVPYVVDLKQPHKNKEPMLRNIERIMESTQIRLPSSASGSVKVGRCDMTAEQLTENITTVYKELWNHFNGRFGIQTLTLNASGESANGCPGLQLWELGSDKIHTLPSLHRAQAEEESENEEEDEESESEEKEQPKKKSKKA